MEEKITEEEYEYNLGRSFESGIMSGIERAARILLDKAISLWERDKENEAELLKSLSKELEKEAKELRVKWDEKHREYLCGA